MITRTGKIARLPRSIREELNLRLLDNKTGADILAWLNALPDVRIVLDRHFGGNDVNEQNLSDWRHGGFEDWLRFQDTRDWIRNLVDRSSDLAEDAGQISVADWLSAPVAVAIGRCIQRIASEAHSDYNQQRHLIALARELARLRNSDHQEQIIRLNHERRAARENAANSSPVNPNQAG